MKTETKTIIESQIYKLNLIHGTLDVARDCFSHFQHHQPTQTELDQYSTHGHETVQTMRMETDLVIAALQKCLDSN